MMSALQECKPKLGRAIRSSPLDGSRCRRNDIEQDGQHGPEGVQWRDVEADAIRAKRVVNRFGAIFEAKDSERRLRS
jgi:hypothetical protein